MNPYTYLTEDELSSQMADKIKTLRLAADWKQTTLAERSGVSLASLRRFEKKGLISLSSLLKLSIALGRQEDFCSLFDPAPIQSIEDLEKGEKVPQRGQI